MYESLGEHLRPLPLWGRLREGARLPASSPPGDLCKLRRGEDRRPLALGKGGGAGSYPLSRLGEGWGEGGGRRGPRDLVEARPPSYAKVSPREKIEMRGPLTTTKAHRSVRNLRRAPPASPPLGETERGRAPSGLFSPRRPLQTPSRGRPTPAGLGKGRRRGVLPPLPLGEGWGEGGGRRGPRDLVEARPPSYAKVSPREKIEMRGPLTTTKAHRSAPLSPSECPAPPPSVIPAKAGIHPSLRPLPLWGRLREGARLPASSPPGDLCKLRRGEDRRPLALGKGGGAGSYPLSRWERVGVRAGGGGGRATLLKPARRVTQRSPPGRRLR